MQWKKQKTSINALKLVIMIILPMTIVLASVLNVLQYRTNITSIFAAKQYVYLSATVDRIARSMDFGKPLENIYGMEAILDEQVANHTSLRNILILDSNRSVIYEAVHDSKFVWDKELNAGQFICSSAELIYPLELPNNSLLVAVADIKEVDAAVQTYIKNLIIFGATLLAVSSAILFSFTRRYQEDEIKKLKNSAFAVLITTQLILEVFIGVHFFANYRASLQILAGEMASTVATELGRLTSAGIPLDEMNGLEEYFADYTARVPDFSKIEFADGELDGNVINAEVLLDNEHQLTLKCTLSTTVVVESLWQLVLNVVLLITASILLIVEVFISVDSQIQENSTVNTAKMRMAVFGLYACINMGMILVPLAAAELYRPELGLSYEFTVASPMTFGMLASLAAAMLSAALLERIGFKRVFMLAVFSSAAGLLLSSFALDIIVFIGGRLLLGFGYGLIMMVARNYASTQDSAEGRTATMSALIAGSITGLAFGSVIGGILADQSSYRLVFIVSALGIIFCPLLLPNLPKTVVKDKPAKRLKIADFMHREILGYLLMLVAPICACGVFMSYVLPIAGNEKGMLAAAMSAVVMINSLLSAYLSPPLTDFIMRRLGASKGVMLYAATTGGAIACFAFFGSIPALVAAAIILSIADSFGAVVLMEGFQEICSRHGQTPSMSIMVFTIVGKGAQAAAPMFMALGGGGGSTLSCVGLAAAAAIGLLLYIVLHRRRITIGQ